MGLFDPCDRYQADPDVAAEHPERDCVSCLHQYKEKVCAEFRRRLLELADDNGGETDARSD